MVAGDADSLQFADRDVFWIQEWRTLCTSENILVNIKKLRKIDF